MQEEQERQARQIKELETERLRQESLLQEKGAQIKVEVHFFLFCEIFSLVQKVLEDENVALVALLGNLKTQLSQVARYLQINTDISPIGPESDPLLLGHWYEIMTLYYVKSILREISAYRQDRRVLQKSKIIRIEFLSKWGMLQTSRYV